MSTRYVDVVNGNDSTGTGAEGAPYATITKAITASANSDNIIVESGIYREEITWQGISQGGAIAISLYARGRVIIDGEDIRSSIVMGTVSLGGGGYCHIRATFYNFIFRNPKDNVFIPRTAAMNPVLASTFTFVNCHFYDQTSNTTGYIWDSSINTTTNWTFNFYYCTFERFGAVNKNGVTPHATSIWTDIKHCIVRLTNTFGADTPANDVQNAYAGGGFVDSTANPPVFVQWSTFDGTEDGSLNRSDAGNQTNYMNKVTTVGYELSDLGCTWHVPFGGAIDTTLGHPQMLTSIAHSGSTWISDANYVNGTDKGPAGAIGNSKTVDTVTQPPATSAAMVSPVWKVKVQNGRTATLKSVQFWGEEDLTPGAGHKDVLDSTSDATRKMQYRANATAFLQTDASPSWTDIGRTETLATTFTQDFYIQTRVIMSLVGN